MVVLRPSMVATMVMVTTTTAMMAMIVVTMKISLSRVLAVAASLTMIAVWMVSAAHCRLLLAGRTTGRRRCRCRELSVSPLIMISGPTTRRID